MGGYQGGGGSTSRSAPHINPKLAVEGLGFLEFRAGADP